jgi:hypothetical protein
VASSDDVLRRQVIKATTAAELPEEFDPEVLERQRIARHVTNIQRSVTHPAGG